MERSTDCASTKAFCKMHWIYAAYQSEDYPGFHRHIYIVMKLIPGLQAHDSQVIDLFARDASLIEITQDSMGSASRSWIEK